ncbi:GGDEF domain-containing protein [Lottiidibacillus patelloidae]|nr:GGDEF domain-containing protein [Lottiidibacillus patelloidae]
MYNNILSFYITTCLSIAIIISVISASHLQFFQLTTWLHFGLWTFIIVLIRIVIHYFESKKIEKRLLSSVEFAVLIILPFPLFCLLQLLSLFISNIFNYDFKTSFQNRDHLKVAIVIISGLCAASVYSYVQGLIDFLSFARTLAIIPTAFIFVLMKLFLLTTFLSIEQNIPFNNVNTLNSNVLLVELLMIGFGALVGGIYLLDPSLILILIIPILLLKKLLNSEEKLAYIDGKTGLYNYRFFDENINKHFLQAVKRKEQLSIIFADMDYLRHINNKYGHVNGDKALQSVAKIIMESIENHIAVRFGGEEFVLVISKLPKQEVITLAEQIRKKVERAKITLDNGKKIHVTISVGVASFPDDANSINQLIFYADKAVYMAKNKGRNIVCHYEKRKT